MSLRFGINNQIPALNTLFLFWYPTVVARGIHVDSHIILELN